MAQETDKILILDFGSQYTQLIARRIRELGVYSEIIPYSTGLDQIKKQNPLGIVLSGGPISVHETKAPQPTIGLFELGIPVLGICYGLQLMAHLLGGSVRTATRREYGNAVIKLKGGSRLFSGVALNSKVWMSHGDDVEKLPEGFVITAKTASAIAAVEDSNRQIYGLQFHPEVMHSQDGTKILRNFLVNICQVEPNWTMEGFVEQTVNEIRSKAGKDRVICALSGGVDSTVAAALVGKAIGSRQTCIFVDTGLLRKGEFQQVLKTYKQMDLKVIGIDAKLYFLKKLKNITDPEQKRRVIGHEFISIFAREAKKLPNVKFLVQGTLYPDVIESAPVKGPSAVIKSHHNVGGLPAKMRLKLIEPLRELFKDEVRKVGKEIGVPTSIIQRQPFPGPGLAVRILGGVTPGRVAVLQLADEIVQQEIKRAKLHRQLWQAFAVLLPVSSVGVMGDNRTYENVLAIRAIESTDGMTADWAKLPYEVMQAMSNRIINEVSGINRVVYDISSKPPATIEWE